MNYPDPGIDDNVDSDLDLDHEPTDHDARHFNDEDTCGQDGCTLGKGPAATAWEALMSGLYREQDFQLENSTHQFAAPDPGQFELVLEHIRPDPKHAIEPMVNEWHEISMWLEEFKERHHYNVKALADGWKGEEFDRFSDFNEELETYLLDVTDKISSVSEELDLAGREIHQQQGGDDGYIPFPDAQIHVDNSGCESKYHFRPPWHVGPCNDLDQDTIESWYFGEDEGSAWRSGQWKEARTEHLVSIGYSQTEAQEEAAEELNMWTTDLVRDYREVIENDAEVNRQDIESRKLAAERSVIDSRYDSSQKPPPSLSNPEDIEVDPGLDQPPTDIGSPPSGGLEDYGSANSGPSPELPDPNSSPGGVGGGGMPGGGAGGSGTPPGDASSDWELPDGDDDDDDEFSDGLQSGGVGGGAGGGVGSGGIGGGGAGAGAGGVGAGAGGMAGGAMGGGRMGGGAGAGGMGRGAGGGGAGAGGGRGAGGGSGSGRGAGGGRMGGGMGGMMPMGGAGAGGGKQDGESKNDDWLHEEDDVWGVGNEEDDPFA